ncbi:hypothetical protein [Rhizobium viscosum]|jgi:hypothetical protein|uniref:Uncharacterized protein n=1 Tax=Rhizobium viscosum TaxID=1673 RepID=A0ABR9IQ62_RHIVS|nr:hypothetical protein [Rhizobium viscosum]MBE1505310.1 hypothetical protein [Rhizobium viscosum]
MEKTTENDGMAVSGMDTTPKLHGIKGGNPDASQKLNCAINKQNDKVQCNFMSPFWLIWQSSVAN